MKLVPNVITVCSILSRASAQIEGYTHLNSMRPAATATSSKPGWDFWKTSPLQDNEGDEWGFNNWGEEAEESELKPRKNRREGRFGLRPGKE